ncbi:RcnB family protein [Ancylobacter oerskovii]|uniref:RcnB family protein n=1 Tax=Ancylobacter oerskovii TaxID=459519 RepID=A0ABW4YZ00_9HYPH|nr:RcnB family protein [Ancylobacter oerskovii]
MLGDSASMAQGAPPLYPHGQQNAQKPHQARPHDNHRPQTARPAPHRSQWSKGKRLPPNYRHDVVRDYGRHRLAPPPRGYNWVRVNNEYMLIGMASGIISSIVRAQ